MTNSQYGKIHISDSLITLLTCSMGMVASRDRLGMADTPQMSSTDTAEPMTHNMSVCILSRMDDPVFGSLI